MNFICTPCQSGAAIKLEKPSDLFLKKMMHEKCRGGTWCDCQHRVGRNAK